MMSLDPIERNANFLKTLSNGYIRLEPSQNMLVLLRMVQALLKIMLSHSLEQLHVDIKEQTNNVMASSFVKTCKKSFQEQTFRIFSEMVENNTVMAKNIERSTSLLVNMTSRINRLIEKLQILPLKNLNMGRAQV